MLAIANLGNGCTYILSLVIFVNNYSREVLQGRLVLPSISRFIGSD